MENPGYGFVQEMSELMTAADILVTKAGPGTISEAFIAGLPIIMYSKITGQEDGNVLYVIENNAGVWAPEPQKVVSVLDNWLQHPESFQKVKDASKNLANPQATRQIARLLVEQVMPTREPKS